MSLQASLDAIQAGDRVRFIVHLINDGEQPVTIPRSQEDTVEVSLQRNDAELWRWTVGIGRRSESGTAIPPTDRVRWPCEWPDPQFGTYTAVATVTLGGATVEATAPVTVTKGVAKAAPTAGPDRQSIRQRPPEDGIDPERGDPASGEDQQR